ncbi:MAG: hypothetical protein AAFV86_22995, partial [Pseudomonadota bacterium]
MGLFEEAKLLNSISCNNQAWTTGYIQNIACDGVRSRIQHHHRAVDWEEIELLAQCADPRRMFTEPWYRNIFEPRRSGGRICGDISPSYSTLPLDGVQYARTVVGAAKIIYMIRDPH